jgi:putative SOS response-associated peptidase YedK
LPGAWPVNRVGRSPDRSKRARTPRRRRPTCPRHWTWRHRRPRTVADGFYEWKKHNGKKQPYYIRLHDGQAFAFAGLCERWDWGDSPIDSCTSVTTDANELVGSIHDRMPVILDPKDYGLWLDPDVQDAKKLEPLLVPYTTEGMAAHPVSSMVNNPKADDPRCIEPVA